MRAAQSVTLPAFEATVAATPDYVRALEAALVSARAAEARFCALIEAVRAISYISDWDERGRVRLLNQHGHELVGVPAGSLIGCDWFGTVLTPEACTVVREQYAAAMASTEQSDQDEGESEWQLITATGERCTIAWRHTLLRDEAGRATGSVASGEDITERLHAQSEIHRLAYTDPLTGLANRSHFDAEARAAVRAGEVVGLLCVDLGHFKDVNDTHGHAAGDELLRAVGGRRADAAMYLAKRSSGPETDR